MSFGRLGYGSVFGKTVRDCWPTALGVIAFLSLSVVVAAAGMAGYGGIDTRSQIAGFASSAPAAMQGMYGPAVGIETLGGFLAWQFAGFFCLIVGIWSIVSLSGAIAAERDRGSLDFLLATPIGAAMVATLAAGLAIFALCLWLSAAVFGNRPGPTEDPFVRQVRMDLAKLPTS